MYIRLYYSMNIEKIYKEHLSGVNMHILRDRYNLKRGVLEYHFKKNNLKIYKYNTKYIVNNNIFNIIDSELKAYLVGFFAADGCVNKDNRISLCLTEQDVYIIELFKNSICKEKDYTTILNVKGAINRRPQVMWRINSPYIVKDLEKYNIKNNKTHLELNMEAIPESLKIHFIRGYFDGDGHVRKNRFEASICSPTKNILLEMQKELLRNDITSNMQYLKSGMFVLAIYNKVNICKFYEVLFKNSECALPRKLIRLKTLYDLVNSEVTKP